ncbi:MAG: DedA family protein [Caldilineaceae bacterium]|nr:DedA family protein [Caldilineaceae bacterium]
MDLQTILLDAMATYGVFAIFVAILLASLGLPLPASFLLVAAGSFVMQGEMDLSSVVVASVLGAVLGDHIGYSIGRIGGRNRVQKLSRRFQAEHFFVQAETTMNRWGGVGIFLSRWLLTAVGPYVNLTSGLMGYHLLHFAFWDILGEALWVILYIQVGRLFSDQLAIISDALGDLTWVVLGVVAIVVIAYKLIQTLRPTPVREPVYCQPDLPAPEVIDIG